jgi:hypothetical protein
MKTGSTDCKSAPAGDMKYAKNQFIDKKFIYCQKFALLQRKMDL